MKRGNYLFTFNFVILVLLLLFFNTKDEKLNNNRSAYKPGIYTVDDLSITDKKTNSNLFIGMQKEEVTNLIGHENEIDFRGIHNYGGLRIFYRDNKVAGLMVEASYNQENRFQTIRGVDLTTTLDEVMERYGKTDILDNFGSYAITYSGKLNGTSLSTNTENDPLWNTKDQEKIYVMSFGFFNNENKSVSGIYISDHRFAYSGK